MRFLKRSRRLPNAAGVVAPARSPRNANYSIDVRLDPSTRALTASEHIVWRNITANPTSELQFHLYWNAWRDTHSTFLRERALSSSDRRPDDDFARLEITSLTYRPESAAAAPSSAQDRGQRRPGVEIILTSAMRFIAPDDGNRDDHTVMAVTLPEPVRPGESVAIDLKWTARVPRPFARTGAVGDFFFLAQWFPKLGVLQDDGWNCHQFHATTEFFSDYGVYDVSLTVPTAGWSAPPAQSAREYGTATAPRPIATTRKTSTTSPGPRAPTSSSAAIDSTRPARSLARHPGSSRRSS